MIHAGVPSIPDTSSCLDDAQALLDDRIDASGGEVFCDWDSARERLSSSRARGEDARGA
jgi:hypothetical protein